ncbi:MAG: CHAT domain-containing protein [Caldilineaceae bacterium]
MDRTTISKLRNILVKLYSDSQTIRRVVDDADLDTSRIILGGNAINIWHGVLDEAQKQGKVDQLIAVVLLEYPNKHAEVYEALGMGGYKQDSSVTQNSGSAAVVTPTTQPAKPEAPPSSDPTLTPARTLPITAPRVLQLTNLDVQLLSTLFDKANKLAVLTEFTDGRTATRVLLMRATATDGVEELPAVVKIGPRSLIEPEWQAAQRQVLNRLPGFAAVQGEPVFLADGEGEQRGALRYAQVGDGVFDVESLSRYSSHATSHDLWQVLAERLLRQLATLWRATQQRATISFQQRYDAILPVNLAVDVDNSAQEYPLFLDARYLTTSSAGLPPLQPGAVVRLDGFVVTEVAADGRTLTLDLPPQGDGAAAYRLRLHRANNDPVYTAGAAHPPVTGRVRATRQSLLQSYIQSHLGEQVDLTQPTVLLSAQSNLPNPLLALPTLLALRQEGWLATIHGDLNLRNILIDPAVRTAHIIDCAAARQDHVLHDLLRLERDLLTDLAAQTFFQENLPPTAIVGFYQQLYCATQGAAHDPGHFALPADLAPALEKLFVMIATVRQAARPFLATPGEWAEYYSGLVIHLLGALKYRDLENAAPGCQPKAIAFWAAAALVGLLQEMKTGDNRRCRELALHFFDITSSKGGNAHSTKPMSPEAQPNNRGSEPPTNLESLPAKGIDFATTADPAPVERRLDVAAPEQATLQRPFLLAVAVRQNSSPRLALPDLPVMQSGPTQLDWPADEPFVRVRAQVTAPECEIVGEDSYSFKLYRGFDSVIYYFSLIPKKTGRLTIIVRLYQETDFLGSTQAQTTVSEQVVGEVPLQLQSSQPVTVKQVAEKQSGSTAGRTADGTPIKILFLAANPLDTVRLSIDEEVRAIQQTLRQADYRIFDVQLGPAVRIEDLQALLLQHRPDILHFSGHGTETSALIFHNAQGNSVQVRGAPLGQLFQILKDNLRCVVLNACYTAELAEGLASVIDCVVGIENAITDSAALQFTTAFYRALGYGRSVQEAFALGRVQIDLAGLGDAGALHLAGANASKLRFVDEPSAAETKPMPAIPQPTPVAPPTNTAAEDTDFLHGLLTQHQRNRQRLLQQKALYGAGEEPLRLLNQLDAEEEAIAEIKRKLGE